MAGNSSKVILKSAQKNFGMFGALDLTGRKFVQTAIINCYELYVHYDESFIRSCCKKQGIKYKDSKPCSMIIKLAMKIGDDCDERTKARIRTYVRVLKSFKARGYSVDTAQNKLDKLGIYFFANPRKNKTKAKSLETDSCKSKQPVFKGSLIEKLAMMFGKYIGLSKSYIIWVQGDKVNISTQKVLLRSLNIKDFKKI